MTKKLTVWIGLTLALIGLGSFLVQNYSSNASLKTPANATQKSTPSPSPAPQVAIDSRSDLQAEITKLTPPDISNDIKALKQEVTR